jgi:hypothetical protein
MTERKKRSYTKETRTGKKCPHFRPDSDEESQEKEHQKNNSTVTTKTGLLTR